MPLNLVYLEGFMFIDKVYVCDVYILKDRIYNKYNTKVYNGKNYNCYVDDYVVNKCEFVEEALVYYSVLQGGFIDMRTGAVITATPIKEKGKGC